ncbi:hypothetical protein BESB_074040 [Besnoitia besnoiti]|uniref:Inositol phospholipid synthesis protein Scs3p n=1 Tax=Besnoitia besnoiti TaxID=94643 RepID=A0A2A9MFV6_BESBE|nr:uncharacterized protein BESB_074040 [Besnoitia besnoiti]PFH34252.1 hypothetical protein BESB_074040 [Besnoitia besnoiti]
MVDASVHRPVSPLRSRRSSAEQRESAASAVPFPPFSRPSPSLPHGFESRASLSVVPPPASGYGGCMAGASSPASVGSASSVSSMSSSSSSVASAFSMRASSSASSRAGVAEAAGGESRSSALSASPAHAHTPAATPAWPRHPHASDTGAAALRSLSPGSPSSVDSRATAGSRRPLDVPAAGPRPFSSSGLLSSPSEESNSSLSPVPSSLTSPTPVEERAPDDEDAASLPPSYDERGDGRPLTLSPSFNCKRDGTPSSGLRLFPGSSYSSASSRRESADATPTVRYRESTAFASSFGPPSPFTRPRRLPRHAAGAASSLHSRRRSSASSAYDVSARPVVRARPAAGAERPERARDADARRFSLVAVGPAEVDSDTLASSSGEESSPSAHETPAEFFDRRPAFHGSEDEYFGAHPSSCAGATFSGASHSRQAAFFVDSGSLSPARAHTATRTLRAAVTYGASRAAPEAACLQHGHRHRHLLYAEDVAAQQTPARARSPRFAVEACLSGESGSVAGRTRTISSPSLLDLPSSPSPRSSLRLPLDDEAAAGPTEGEDHRRGGGWRKFLTSLAAMRARRRRRTTDGSDSLPGGDAATVVPGDEEEDGDSGPHSTFSASPQPPASLASRLADALTAARDACVACMRPGRLPGRTYFYLLLVWLLLLLFLVLCLGTRHHEQKLYRLRPKQVAELQLHTTQRLWSACLRSSSATPNPSSPNASLAPLSGLPVPPACASLFFPAVDSFALGDGVSLPSLHRVCRQVGPVLLASAGKRQLGANAQQNLHEVSLQHRGDPSPEAVTAGALLTYFLQPCEPPAETQGASAARPLAPCPSRSPAADAASCELLRGAQRGGSGAWRALAALSDWCLSLKGPQVDSSFGSAEKPAALSGAPEAAETRASQTEGSPPRSRKPSGREEGESCAASSSAGMCVRDSARLTVSSLSDAWSRAHAPASLPGVSGSSPVFAFPRNVSFFFFHSEGLPSSFLGSARELLVCTEADAPLSHVFALLQRSPAYVSAAAAFSSFSATLFRALPLPALRVSGGGDAPERLRPGLDSDKQTGGPAAVAAPERANRVSPREGACVGPGGGERQGAQGLLCAEEHSDFEHGVVSLLAASPSPQRDCLSNPERCLRTAAAAGTRGESATGDRLEAYASTLRAAFGNLLPHVFLLNYESALAAREAEETRVAGSDPLSPAWFSGDSASHSHKSPGSSPSFYPLTSLLPDSSLLFDFSVFSTPCYPLSRFLHRRLVSWGGLQLHLLLFGGWLHSLFASEPLTLLHVPRALFLALLSAYRGAVLYDAVNWLEKTFWKQTVGLSPPEELAPDAGAGSLAGNGGAKETRRGGSELESLPARGDAATSARTPGAADETAQTRSGVSGDGAHGVAGVARGPGPGTPASSGGQTASGRGATGEGGDERSGGGAWQRRRDFSDHVVLYVMAIVFIAIEVSAARSSHAPPTVAPGAPAPPSGAAEASAPRQFFTHFAFRFSRTLSSLLYAAVFIYYSLIFASCLYMAYYTARFFHTPEEIWLGLAAGCLFLVLPIILILEVLERPSLQRIGIGSGEKKAAERAAAAAAANAAATVSPSLGGRHLSFSVSPQVAASRHTVIAKTSSRPAGAHEGRGEGVTRTVSAIMRTVVDAAFARRRASVKVASSEAALLTRAHAGEGEAVYPTGIIGRQRQAEDTKLD